MLMTFLIMLREGLEAALIIGIMASYVVQRGRTGALSSIWLGAAAAIVASVALGTALALSGMQFPQREQEMFEAAVAVIAVLLLLSMVFWMRKAGRKLRSEIEGEISRQLDTPQAGFSLALAGTAFLIVGREGVESVMFMVAILQQATGPSMLTGALLGVAVAVALATLIFQFGVRINLSKFFRITGAFVLLVASGLAAGVLRHLHEAGVWNFVQGQAYDLSQVLPVDGAMGVLLGGIFGYTDAPSWGEVLVYLAVLLPALFLFLRPLPLAKPLSGERPAAQATA